MTEEEKMALNIFETTPAKGLGMIATMMAEFLPVSSDDAWIAMTKVYIKLTVMKKQDETSKS